MGGDMTQSAIRIEDTETFQFRHLEIDWAEMLVMVDGKDVHLTPLEFKLLSLLVRRRGWVVPYAQILREVWGPAYIGDRSNLKLYVWYLRRKIERDASNPELIQTRRGIGYLFAARQAVRAA